MDNNEIELLLIKYQRRQTSPGENKLIEQWLNNANNDFSQWQHLDQSEREQWLNNLHHNISEDLFNKKGGAIKISTRILTWKTIAAAAAVIVFFIALFLSLQMLRINDNANQYITITVPANQKRRIVLSDGSTVWINSKSLLRFPRNFQPAKREVYLSGEAYFDIKHKQDRPFIVHTSNIVTTVLGTAFNINAPTGEKRVVITVARGKVSVSDGKRLLGYVTPNQQISYNLTTHQPTKSSVNASDVTLWQQAEIRFDNLTFGEAAQQLEDRFNVKITFTKDNIKNCRFSGSAMKADNLDEILKIICAFNHASYKRMGDRSILIDGEECDY